MAEPIAHGGRVAAARRRYPAAPEPWIDLSTGINPLPYPLPAVLDAAWARLPEPEDLAALEAAAARAYGVADPACVVAAPGTQSLIQWLPTLQTPGRVAVLGPTYGEHAACWAAAGHAVRIVPGLPDAAEAEVAVLCHPNNPDGRRHPLAALAALAAALAARGGLLVVDESFADLEGCSLAPLLPRAGLVLLRSVGKTYGLAGLRLGFGLAAPDWAARLRAALGPWAVSGPAVVVGGAALADAAWRAATAARLQRDTARLDRLLAAAGCTAVGGTLLFRLVADGDAAGLADRLGRAGILVRCFADHPQWLRFGLPPNEAAWQRLSRALG